MGIDWAIGDVFNGYLVGTMAEDVWDQTKKLNSEGLVSPVIGFNADLTTVGVEATNCASVVNEYLANFQNGTVDIDVTYQQMVDKLKAAGSEKLIVELQRQLDAFMASKK